MDLNDPKYVYADILIAMANADGNVADSQREIIDGIFKQMDLDRETTEKMWMTPRTLDVVQSILKDISDENFKCCLLKDCYLLAYADGVIVPAEHKMLANLSDSLHIDDETVNKIHDWVKVALEQQKKAAELFGSK